MGLTTLSCSSDDVETSQEKTDNTKDGTGGSETNHQGQGGSPADDDDKEQPSNPGSGGQSQSSCSGSGECAPLYQPGGFPLPGGGFIPGELQCVFLEGAGCEVVFGGECTIRGTCANPEAQSNSSACAAAGACIWHDQGGNTGFCVFDDCPSETEKDACLDRSCVWTERPSGCAGTYDCSALPANECVNISVCSLN